MEGRTAGWRANAGAVKKKRRRRKRNPARRRQPMTAIFVCVFLLVLLLASIARDASQLRRFLIGGAAALAAAKPALGEARVREANRLLARAEAQFNAAGMSVARPPLAWLRRVPVAGANLRALGALGIAGAGVARAGREFAEAQTAPSGAGTMISGQIDTNAVEKALPHLAQATADLEAATTAWRNSPRRFLIGPVSDARARMGRELKSLSRAARAAQAGAGLLPGFVGIRGDRAYLLVVQNNAELRATGGLIGNYGVVSARNGKLTLEAFDEIHKLQARLDTRDGGNGSGVKLPEEYAVRYGRYRAGRLWLNSNMSPDFPTVAAVLLEMYRIGEGRSLDGVIAIDPMGLSDILEVTGPVELPESRIPISAENAVKWTLSEAYETFPERGARKDFLKEVAEATWRRLLSTKVEDPLKLAGSLGNALSGRHLILFSSDAKEQSLLERMGWAGRLGGETSDGRDGRRVGDRAGFLMVVVENHGGNKVDYYLKERIHHRVELAGDIATVTTRVELENSAPPGLPRYVAGEGPLSVRAGASRARVSVYASAQAQLVGIEGVDTDTVETGRESGKSVFSTYMLVSRGKRALLTFTYVTATSLAGRGGGQAYELLAQHQPILNPALLRVELSWMDEDHKQQRARAVETVLDRDRLLRIPIASP